MGNERTAENGVMNLTLCTFESGGQPFFNVTTSVKYTLSYTRIARTLTVGTPILQRLVRGVDLRRQLGRRHEFSQIVTPRTKWV